MQTPTRRDWRVPSDALGPKTQPRLRLTRRGIGGSYALLGNPISVTVDPVLGCIPWLSLRGGTDPASNAARDAQLADPNLQASVSQPGSTGSNPYTLQDSASTSSPARSGSSPAVLPRGGGTLAEYIRRIPGGGVRR